MQTAYNKKGRLTEWRRVCLSQLSVCPSSQSTPFLSILSTVGKSCVLLEKGQKLAENVTKLGSVMWPGEGSCDLGKSCVLLEKGQKLAENLTKLGSVMWPGEGSCDLGKSCGLKKDKTIIAAWWTRLKPHQLRYYKVILCSVHFWNKIWLWNFDCHVGSVMWPGEVMSCQEEPLRRDGGERSWMVAGCPILMSPTGRGPSPGTEDVWREGRLNFTEKCTYIWMYSCKNILPTKSYVEICKSYQARKIISYYSQSW